MSQESEAKKSLVAGVFSRVAQTYDQVGPRFFSHFGKRLVALADLAFGSSVLHIATGCGALLFPAAERIGPEGHVMGIDIAPSMVTETAQEIGRRGIQNAQTRQMDAEHLAFASGTFDAVLCGFGLFFFPDAAGAMRETWRVLRPDGIVAVSTWGKTDDRWAWVDALNTRYNAKVRLKSHPFDQPGACRDALRTAGFSDVQVAAERAEFVYADEEEWWATHWSHAYRAVLERVAPDALERYKAELFTGLQAHKEPGGGIREAFEVLFTTGKHSPR